MIHLSSGAHDRRADGMCAMEAAAYIAGEKHSDQPVCVSPVIGSFMRQWNDGLPTDAERDRLLKPLLPIVLHTNTGAQDEGIRAWLATDWLVRVQAPAWLDLAGLPDHAANLRNLPPLTTSEIAVAVAVRSVINAARAAAWAAARDAAWAAAWDAAGAAARDAAWAAARDAARAAAGAAARDAAWAALRPIVETLQASAQDLVRRMAAVGEVHERRMVDSRWREVCENCETPMEVR